MNQINRREFLERSLALGATAALPVSAWSAEVRRASDVIELGPAKVKVSRMAIGTGSFGGGHSSNQMRKLGADGVANLWWNGFDNGVFFWDSADSYGTHAAIKIALKKVPREKVTILTKSDSSTAEKMKADLDRFRQEMGTDYIDIVLLHGRMDPEWDQKAKGAIDVLSEAKAKKLVRTVGISCHSVAAMKVAAKSSWLEVCMARINPAGVRMDAETDTVLPVLGELKANGKGLIGMKILGEGQLVDRLDEALRFAVTKDAVHCFTIGCESRAEFMDNLSRIAKVAQPG
jgi:predicted aldo/keto reductase-like oxidoreductase